ncbi:hypothetical protein EV294_101443 [Paenibacillus sp. BK033]|nr:hypothetical protein EV294_101443 [Paenibacillus sp. BK033]
MTEKDNKGHKNQETAEGSIDTLRAEVERLRKEDAY